MGLDETNLHVLMASGTPVEQVHAETVYKLLSRGKHWVLGELETSKWIDKERFYLVDECVNICDPLIHSC